MALGVPACLGTPAASSGAGLVAEELAAVQETHGWEWEGWLTREGEAVVKCA